MKLCSILFLAFALFCAGCSRATNSHSITWAVGRDVTGTMQKLVAEFMRQNPGLTVTLIEMPESASTQRDSYVTYLISRDPSIDIYSVDITWPAEFAAAGWILPLDTYFPSHTQKEFLPGPIDGCRYQGKIYAVPWFTDAGLLYYRTDLLEKEGIEKPETWRGLVQAARVIQKKYKVKGFVFQAAQYEGLVCTYLEFLWSFGGTATDASGKVTIDTPEARAALEFFVGLIREEKVAPRKC